MNSDPTTATNVRQAVPFFMVRDIQVSIGFYIDGIGFKMTNSWVDKGRLRWCWLQLDGASVMLQEYVTQERHISPPEKSSEGVSIYFICEDALIIYETVRSHGLPVSEPFVGNNMWVVGLKDPDGYNLFFESATDVPEETRYSHWKK
ncbi:MAG TPA: VOC family protein [Chitinophagaceae bacterium]|nr:VOC family protein [Chitinophagaceae bacterium]